MGAWRYKSANFVGAELPIGTIAVVAPTLSPALRLESGQSNNVAAKMVAPGLIGIIILLSRWRCERAHEE
jgi:hypothetical protein